MGEQADRNYSQAAKWYHKAANQHHAPAQYHLAVMYETGKGVSQDKAKADEWYQHAARFGYQGANSYPDALIEELMRR